MPRKTVFEMDAGAVWEALVQKAERKGRTREEAERIICWLTGYTPETLAAQFARGIDYGTLFREAPAINPKSAAVTGVICGVRVEEIADPLLRQIRCLDKLVDELAKGRPMEKILRSGDEPATVDAYIAAQSPGIRPLLEELRATLRAALPQAKEVISWGMPTYRGKGNLIHFAAQKKHIGLYPGDAATAHFADRLADYAVSKGSIRFPYTQPLPLALIAEIAAWCGAQELC